MDKYIESIIKILNEVNKYEDIEANTDLMEAGFLNSLNLLYLITELEDRYELTIPESEVKPENFSSVKQIAILVDELVKKGK